MTELSDNIGLEFVVDVPPRFQSYLDITLVRLQTIFPDCRFSDTDCAILVQGPKGRSEDVVRKAILHTVYREKIYAETLSMRQALVEAVTAR